MTSPARLEAFRILRRVETGRSYASDLLAARRLDHLSDEDRRLTHELVLGVLRWQRQLDYFIERYARRSIRKLDAPVLLALRLGLYQIRFLERVPQWAAVSESVELVRKRGARSAASLVNAVLRRACQQQPDVPGQGIREEWERVSVELSHPRWLVTKWIMQFGSEEALGLMRANNTAPRTALRINPLRGSSEEIRRQVEGQGVELQPSPAVPGAYIVTRGTLAEQSPLMREGSVYLQDEASQLIATLLDAKPGMRILDLCAAPGGKSSQLAGGMGNDGLIIAGDLHLHRLRLLKRTCQRLGATIVHPIALEGTRPLPVRPGIRFDRVLIDAPCSGTGTLRRHPEIKWRLRPEDLDALAEIQIQLLRSVAAFLAPGGRLVYSTCSLEPDENEAVVARFRSEAPSFRLLTPEADESLLDPNGFVRTFPHRHQMDGFFAAVMSSYAPR